MNRYKGAIKICHVISGDIWGGAEAQSYSLIKALAYTENINIEVIVFNSGELYRKLSSENIKTYLVKEADRNVVSIVLNIYRRIKQNKIDIVHAHGFKENFTAGIAAKLNSTILVRTHHGKGMITGTKGLYTYIEKINEKFLSQGLIAVSEDLKKYLIERQFNGDKIKVIHNGLHCPEEVSGDIEGLKETIGIGKNERIIGIVGRLVPVKNHLCFLDSAEIMLRNYDNVCFVAVGDGQLLDELKAYARSLGIDEKVKFVGFKSDVRIFLELFDILAITSFHEGVPISMLEAMCAGVPIVSTKVGGIPEIIQNEYNGLLVPENDCAALSKAYIRLLENRQLYEDVSRNAENDIMQKYSLLNNVTETISFYKRFIL